MVAVEHPPATVTPLCLHPLLTTLLAAAMRGTGFEPEQDGRLTSFGAATCRVQILVAHSPLRTLFAEKCAGPDLNRLNFAHSVRSFRASNPLV